MSRWRVRVAVAVVAGLIFAGVIGDDWVRPPGVSGSWSYVPMIGFAAVLGAGYRSLRRAESRNPPAD